MRTVASYGELSPLLSAQLKPGVRTNAFTSPETYRREIEQGALSVEELEGGLLLFHRRAGFWRMNFYLRGPAAVPDLPGAVVTEIPLRQRDQALRDTVEELESQGFRLLFWRQRMARPKDAPLSREPSPFLSRVAGPADREAAETILTECFDPLTGCLPQGEELAADLAAGNLLLTEEKGVPAGLLHIGPGRGSTELRHLAVSAPFRRRGAARALMPLYMEVTANARSLVWVRRDNAPAVAFYENQGYAPDGFAAAVLARKEENHDHA